MQKHSVVPMVCLATLAVVTASASVLAQSQHDWTAAPHWTYAGATGPDHWEAMDPRFTACGKGKDQSPIDLESRDAKTGKNGAFHIAYERTDVALVNNGHTIQANVKDPNDTVTLDGDTYHLAQFHFHTPSEHTADGQRYKLEAHFVNEDSNKRALVVGVLVREGKPNPGLAPVFSQLPTSEESPAGQPISVDLASILPKDHRAFVYTGSLTTPPCTEGVQWVVLEHPIEMSREQIDSFAKIFHDNHRPLQKVNGREIDDESE